MPRPLNRVGAMFVFTYSISASLFVEAAKENESEQERKYLLRNQFIQDNQPEQAAYPIEGVSLGQGWDLVTGRRTQGTCIEGGSEVEIPGSSSTTQYKYLFDREQIYNSLGLTASASYGGFGWSASVSTSFSETSLADRARTRILSTTLVDKGGIQISPSPERMFGIRLSDQAGKLLDNAGGADKFRKLCGDGFVLAIRRGGQLDVIYELKTALSEYSSAFNLSMSASGYGASANMTLDKTRRDTLNSDDTSIRLVQSGGVLSSPTTKESLVAKIENYPNFEKGAAAPYRIVVWPYSMLPNWKSGSKSLSLMNARAFFMRYQRLMDLSALYTDSQLRSDLYYFPFYPGGKKSSALTKQATLLRAAARCYETLISDCMKYGKCSFELNQVEQCKLESGDADFTYNDRFAINSLVYGAGMARLALSKSARRDGVSVDALKFESIDDSLAIMLNSGEVFKSIGVADSSVNFKDSEWIKKSGTDLYYALLANAPMKRMQLEDKDGKPTLAKAGDESRDALTLCEGGAYKGKCILDGDQYYKALFDSETQHKQNAMNILSTWVLQVRLLPLSQAFCAQSLMHPMCRSPEQLIEYLPQEANFTVGADANFVAQTPTPPPTPVRPPKLPPREPIDRPCPPSICL